ncbi:NAD(P)H-quinone oxidoreductase [Gordonia sp. TBRC 11910]|uniref:NAD(P)H-quinone oxidoreductase n=1 Tax=Gordonia asplenii TaxID=2725283 RepID=A0A848LCM5_9ACTN|nr:NAD(P)H-quinone oxidoreductase [Gordonia asplenii]NMO05298.1 NAD(P)H-quinone oxidoreductase [Gordonia asplenii]
MRAIVAENSELVVVERPTPEPAGGEVLIKVVAAGLNRADLMQRQGYYPPPPGASDVLGLEVSGEIVAVGLDVVGWSVGDQVCALLAGGGYAEYVNVPAAQVLPIPYGVDLRSAAALPEVACTIVSNVVMAAHLAAGETLLIHGGASGIGTHAIQLAKALGARVAVTAGSAEKLRTCLDLGADIAINYRDDDFAKVLTDLGGADVILDIIGAKYLGQNVSALRTGGRMVIIGMQGGVKGELNIGALMAKRASIIGTTLRARPVDGPGGKAEIVANTLAVTWPLIAGGSIKPIVSQVFSFDDAAAAQQCLERGEATGKVLLDVAG